MEDRMMIQHMRMKNMALLLIAIFSIGFLFAQTPFTIWDFEASNLNPSTGAGTLTTIGGITSEYITGFTGTGTGGLALQTTGYPEQGAGNQTAGIQALVSTAGKTNIVVSWHQRNSNTGASRVRLQYTLNGTTWTDFEANASNATNINTMTSTDSGYDNGLYIIDAGATWFSRSASFVGIPQANNNANFGVRLVSAFVYGTSEYGPANPSGAYGTGGTYRYDNLTFGFTDSNTVLAPVFDPNGGVFSAPVQVTITCPTADAQIYYTLDGNDPTQTSTLYANPISISQTTTLKAKAFKTGMAASDVTSATYSFAVQVSNLSQLRQQNPDGETIYNVTGEVILSYYQSFRYQKFVQDANAGILIDDYSHVISTNYNIGDGITGLSGKISEYNGMLQFVPVANPGQPSSTNNNVVAVTATLADLTANFNNYESRLVSIENISFVNSAIDTFAVGTVYQLSDGTNSFNFRTSFYDADYIGGFLPTGQVTIACIPHERTDGQFVASRNLADLSYTSNNNIVVEKTRMLQGNYPNPFNPTTTIAYQMSKSEPVTITVYNLKGQKVRTLVNEVKTAGNHTVVWNGMDQNGKSVASGIYYYKLSTNNHTEVRKAILMK